MTMPHTATPAYLAALAQKRNHPPAEPAAEQLPADHDQAHADTATVAAANAEAAAAPQAPPTGPHPAAPERDS